MLTHIVCWKYKEETTTEKRDEHLAKIRDLPNEITVIESFAAGADILHLERSFDTGLVAGFADRKALDEYTIHPAHQKVVSFGKEVAERVISVDFIT